MVLHIHKHFSGIIYSREHFHPFKNSKETLSVREKLTKLLFIRYLKCECSRLLVEPGLHFWQIANKKNDYWRVPLNAAASVRC